MRNFALLTLVLWPSAALPGAEQPTWPAADFRGERHVFHVAESRAFVILPPRVPAERRIPWVWYAPTIGNYPNARLKWYFDRLIEAGVAIAGIDVGETYANPEARARFWAFYQEARRRFPLTEKACLLAQSRGGLNHYMFAAQHPDAVRCIAGIYPVMDLSSYPGLPKAAKAYGMSSEELAVALPSHNPIDNLQPIARAGIPILHLHGDRDTLVPAAANSEAGAERYRMAGGTLALVTVQGKGHAEVPEFFQSATLLEFLLRQAKNEEP